MLVATLCGEAGVTAAALVVLIGLVQCIWLLLMLSKHSGLVVSFGVIAILSLPAHFLLVEADFGSAACRSGGAEH
jgi:hypothetical protein